MTVPISCCWRGTPAPKDSSPINCQLWWESDSNTPTCLGHRPCVIHGLELETEKRSDEACTISGLCSSPCTVSGPGCWELPYGKMHLNGGNFPSQHEKKNYRKNCAQFLKMKFRKRSSHSIHSICDVIENLYYTYKRMNRGPKLGDAASLCVFFLKSMWLLAPQLWHRWWGDMTLTLWIDLYIVDGTSLHRQDGQRKRQIFWNCALWNWALGNGFKFWIQGCCRERWFNSWMGKLRDY